MGRSHCIKVEWCIAFGVSRTSREGVGIREGYFKWKIINQKAAFCRVLDPDAWI